MFVPFRTRQSFPTNYPRHIHNLLNQKNRVFRTVLDLQNNAYYKTVCTNIDNHLKILSAYRERKLAKRCSLRKLHLHLRSKIKVFDTFPNIVDVDGRICTCDSSKVAALGAISLAFFFATKPPMFQCLKYSTLVRVYLHVESCFL